MSFVTYLEGGKNLCGEGIGTNIKNIFVNDPIEAEQFISTITDGRLATKTVMFSQVNAVEDQTGIFIQKDLVSFMMNNVEEGEITPDNFNIKNLTVTDNALINPKDLYLNSKQLLPNTEYINIHFNTSIDNTTGNVLRFNPDTNEFEITNEDKMGFSEITRQEQTTLDGGVPYFDAPDNELKFTANLLYTAGNQRLTAENIRANDGLEARNFAGDFRRVLVDPYPSTNISVGAVLAITALDPLYPFQQDNFTYAWVNTVPPATEDTRTFPSGSGTDGGGGGGGGDPWDPKGPGGPGGGGSATPSNVDPDPDPDGDPDPDDPTPPVPPFPNDPLGPDFGSRAVYIDPSTEQAVNAYCNDYVTQQAIKQFKRFTRLLDTPTDYIGWGNYLCKVALTEDGIEFTDVIELDSGTLINPAITFKNSTNNTGINLFGTTGISFVDNATNFLEVDPVNAKYNGIDWLFNNNVQIQKFLTIGNIGGGTHYILPDNKPSPETSDYILVYQANTNTVDWELKNFVAPTDFISLTDTPNSYQPADANRYLAVNSTPDGVIFIDPKWNDLTDVEDFSVPAANLPARLNATNDGVIFKANTYTESSDTPNNYTDDFAESLDNGATDLYRGKLTGLNDAGTGFVYRKVAPESAVITVASVTTGNMTANTWVHRTIGNLTTSPGTLKNEYCGAVIGNDVSNGGIKITRAGSYFIQGFGFGYQCGEFALRIIRFSDSAVVVPPSSAFLAGVGVDGNTLGSTMPYHLTLTSSQVPETYRLEAICTDTRNGDGWGKDFPVGWGLSDEYRQWVHCYRFSNYCGQNDAFDT